MIKHFQVFKTKYVFWTTLNIIWQIITFLLKFVSENAKKNS